MTQDAGFDLTILDTGSVDFNLGADIVTPAVLTIGSISPIVLLAGLLTNSTIETSSTNALDALSYVLLQSVIPTVESLGTVNLSTVVATLTVSEVSSTDIVLISEVTQEMSLLLSIQATINSIQSDITNLNDLSIADVQTALTNQGYTSARAVLLDYLNAAITSIQGMSEAELHLALDSYSNKDGYKADTSLCALESNATINKDNILTSIAGIPDAVLDEVTV